MNAEEFNFNYKNFRAKEKININCADCGKLNSLGKSKAMENIRKNAEYLCRSCGKKRSHIENPMSKETKDKIGEKLIGQLKSDVAKNNMSLGKKEFYQTEEGKLARANLSKMTAEKHEQGFFNGSKRKILDFKEGKIDKPTTLDSSYELQMARILNEDDNVISYSAHLNYYAGIDGEGVERHRVLDFLVTYKNGKKKIIEVKPKSRIGEEPISNQIADNKMYAECMGYSFEVYTEDNLGMTCQEMTDLADKYLESIDNIDRTEIKKQRHNESQKKYYQENNETQKFLCNFCQKEHEVRITSYNSNVERNGRYICEKEGGSIAGRKPKKKKINPYANEGKKQCNGPLCEGLIKLFEFFNPDKSRSDGWASICKECNSHNCKIKYDKKINKQ